MPVRDKIFVSYSHEDSAWRDKFLLMLSPPINSDSKVQLWSDQLIPAGQRWSNEIDDAIASSKVALLLVTPHFFRSEFIQSIELPEIMRQQEDGLLIRWVPVMYADFESHILGKLQASHPTASPLESLTDVECRQAILAIGREIKSHLGQFGTLTGDARDDILASVRDRLQNIVQIEKEMVCGENSVLYAGKQGGRNVAVKVFTKWSGKSDIELRFIEQAQKIVRLRDPAFVQIYELILDPPGPACIVMESVGSRPLVEVLDRGEPMVPQRAARVIRQIARALGEMHGQGIHLGGIRPSNIFIDNDNVIRISALSMTNVVLEIERLRGTLTMSREFMQYISPEQALGDHIDDKTDQYVLGMLALHLITGRAPVNIVKLSDMVSLFRFHDDPFCAGRRDGVSSWIEETPELYHIVNKMLEKDPAQRFENMEQIYDLLRPLVGSRELSSPVERIAKQFYLDRIRGKNFFYRKFYQILFRIRPSIASRFPGLARPAQFRLLDMAIEQLLNYRDVVEPTALTRTADRHKRFDLTADDWDAFLVAFVECISSIESDRDVVTAWRVSLRPGIEYLKRKCSTRN